MTQFYHFSFVCIACSVFLMGCTGTIPSTPITSTPTSESSLTTDEQPVLAEEVSKVLPILDAPQRARDTARVANLNNVATLLEMYHMDYGHYPISEKGTCTEMGEELYSNSPLVQALTAENTYVSKESFPRNPSSMQTLSLCPEGSTGIYYQSLAYENEANMGYMLVSTMELEKNKNITADRLTELSSLEELHATLARTPRQIPEYPEYVFVLSSQ